MTKKGESQVRWTSEEDDAVRSGAASLPGRSNAAVCARRAKLGVKVGPAGPTGRLEAWTQAEDELVRSGASTLPGRTYAALHRRRAQLGVTRPPWTDEQIKLLLAGARAITGRTQSALASARARLGVRAPPARWSAAEVAALDSGAPVPGRSAEDVRRAKATRLGLAARPVPGVQPKVLAHEVTRAEELLIRVRAAVPRGYGPEVWEEVVADALVRCLETGDEPARAVAAVTRATRARVNGLSRRSVSYDDAYWLADSRAGDGGDRPGDDEED